MKTFSVLAAAAAATSVFATPTEELAPRSSSFTSITVKGNAFFKGSERFYIRGVDYQPGGSSDLADPIADEDICKRDIVEFKKLGINTVRIYTVDNTANHDACMSALEAAGIYLVLDVNTPKYSINRDNPHASYNSVYLQSIFATIDAFAGYANTLAFFSGNEVINDDSSTSAAPYVKAVTRDMRQYIGSRSYRSIPVGYSAADVDTNRWEMAQFMNCGTDDERSDFFAFNDYSWCDPSSFTTSGWDKKVEKFKTYGIPLFLSEYGCITNTRKFEEVASLYSSKMTGVYSGGLVYEYLESGNHYGLATAKGSTVTEGKDFLALAAAFKGTKAPTGDGGYNSTGGANGCPVRSKTWNVTGDALPAIPSGAMDLMKAGAGKGPGLKGSGSQNAAGVSTATASPGSGSVEAAANAPSSTSSDGSSTTENAAAIPLGPMNSSPFVSAMIVAGFTALGAMLL